MGFPADSSGMDVDDALDYDKVNSAILGKYEINPDTYRLRFRSMHVELEETPREPYVRLKELFGKWVQPKDKTAEEISEIMITTIFKDVVS